MRSVRTAGRGLAAAAGGALVLALSGCGYLVATAAGVVFSQDRGDGGVVVLRSEDADLLVARGPFDAGDTTEARGALVPVAQLRLTATRDTVLRAVTLRAVGSGDDADVAVVRLHLDQDGDGVPGTGDAQLGAAATFSADDGEARFDGLTLDIAQGGAVDLLVVLQTPADAPDGATFGVSLAGVESLDAVTLEGGATLLVDVFGVPLSSGVKTISSVGTLRVAAGPAAPGPAGAFPDAQDVGVLQLDLRPSSVEAVAVSQLVLRASGSGDDLVHVTRADLWLDADSDGALDALVDAPLLLDVAASGDDGTLTFGGLGVTLPAGSITRWLVVYDLAGLAPDGASFRVELAAGADLGVQGVTSLQAIVPTGTPVTGAPLTIVRGALALGLGPLNAARTTTAGAALVPALQLTATAGGVEPVAVSAVGVRATGSGDDALDLSAVRLVLDADQDGVADAGELVLSGPATFAADGQTLVLGGFLRTLAPGAAETWLVVVDTAGGASGGDQFVLALSGPADVTAAGQASGLPPTLTVSTTGGGAITVRGTLSLSAGPAPPPPQAPLAGAADVPTLQARLTAGAAEGVLVGSLRLEPSGSGDDAVDVALVQLFHDVDGSGGVSAGDVLLGQGTFAADGAPLVLSGAPLVSVPAGGAVDLLVRYQLSGQASQGDTLATRVAPAGVVATGAASGAPVPAGGVAVQGADAVVRRARLTLSAGPAHPAASTVLNVSADVPVHQARALAGPGEPVELTSARFAARGTVSPQAGIVGVRLHLDDDQDGDPAGDPLLGSAAAFSAAGDVTFTLAPGAAVVPAGGAALLLLVVDLGGTAAGGQTFAADLVDVTGVGTASGLAAERAGLPVTGNTRTVVAVGGLALASGAAPPPPSVVYAGQAHAVQQVQLTATGEAVRVQTWTVRGAGTGNDAAGLALVSLYRDDNGNGALDGDTLLGSGTFAADPGVLTLAPGGGLVTVPTGPATSLLVVYTFGAGATGGSTFGAAAVGPADVGATGVTTGGGVTPTGSAAAGALKTFGTPGALAVSNGPANPTPPATGFAGSPVPVQQVRLTATTEAVRVDSLTLRGAGTGDDAAGLSQVALYIDDNQNGVLDADTLLVTTTFPGDPGVRTLAPGGGLLTVTPGAPVCLLVVDTLSPAAGSGQTFGAAALDLSLEPGDLAGTGLSSGLGVAVSGRADPGGLLTVGAAGALAIADGPATPLPGAVVDAYDQGLVQQVRLTATGESVRVSSYTVRGTGTGVDHVGITQVALYRDQNGNGVLDGDVLVVSGAFGGDPGALTLAPPGGLFTVTPGTPLDLLVAYTVGPQGAGGQTFSAAAVVPGDVLATGLSSGAAITPTGGAAAGAFLTYGTAVDPDVSTVVAAPPTAVADGLEVVTVTITVRDRLGNPLAGRLVSLSATPPAGSSITQPASATDGAGQTTGTLTATTAQAVTISAVVDPAGEAVVLDDRPQVTFDAGAVDPAQGSVVAAPAAGVTADGVAASTITVTVLDAQGNPVPGAVVVLSASPPGGATVTDPAGPTDAAGQATGSVRSTTAEPKTISATANGAPLSDTEVVTFVAGAPSSAASTVAAAPPALVADGVAESTITVTVLDAQGNPVAGRSVSLAASPGGAGVTVDPPLGPTDALGVTTGRVRSTAAGDQTVFATVDPGPGEVALSQRPVVTFFAGPVDPAASSVVVIPTSGLVADGMAQATVTVTVRDAQGNPIQGATVDLSASPGGASVTDPLFTTDAQGEATGTLSSDSDATYTITATADAGAGAVLLDDAPTVQFVTGAATGVSASLSNVSAAPGTALADGVDAVTVSITVRDVAGVPMAGRPVLISVSGGGSTITQPPNTDLVGFTQGSFVSTVAGAKTITVTVDPGVSQTVLSQQPVVTFAPGPVGAGTSTVVAAPDTIEANGVETSTITVTVLDAQGNPIPNATVTLAAAPALPGATLVQPAATTDALGVTTGTYRSTEVSTVSISATADAGAGAVAITQTAALVVEPGDPSSAVSTVVVAPASLLADGVATATITVTLLDAQGNPVPGANVVLSVPSGSGHTLVQPPAPSDASGVATGSIRATVSGPRTIVATAVIPGPDVTLSQQPTVTFVPGPLSAAVSTVIATPATDVPADGVTPSTVTVTVRDALGNGIPGLPVLITASGAGASFSPSASGTSDASGVVTAFLTSTVAETKTLTAFVNPGPGQTQLAAQPTVTFVGGATAGGATWFSATASAAWPERYGAALTSFNGSLWLIGGYSGGSLYRNDVHRSADGTTWLPVKPDGHADFEGRLGGAGVAFGGRLYVFGGDNQGADPTDFVSSADGVTWTPAGTPAGLLPRRYMGVAVHAGRLWVVAGEDGSGGQLRDVWSFDGVTWTQETAAAAFTARSSVVLLSFGGELWLLGGQVGAAASSEVWRSADGVTWTQVTQTTPFAARYAHAGWVHGGAMLVGAGFGGDYRNDVWSSTDGAAWTQLTADAEFTARYYPAFTSHDQRMWIAGGYGGAYENDVWYSPSAPPSATTSSLSAAPASGLVAGTGRSTITVFVRDGTGSPLSGRTVQLAAAGGGTSFTNPGAGGVTDALGRFTADLGSTLSGTKTVTAVVDPGPSQVALVDQAQVTFVAGAVDGGLSTVDAAPATGLLADGVEAATVTVVLRDGFGNPVPGAPVTLAAAPPAGATFAPDASGTTDATGAFVRALTATAPGLRAVSATSGATPVTDGADVTFDPAPALTVSQPAGLVDGTVTPGAQRVAMLRVRLAETSGQGGAQLTALAVDGVGTGHDADDVTLVELWHDADADGSVSAGDVRLGAGAFVSEPGGQTFAGLSHVVGAAAASDLLVTFSFGTASVVTPGETYRAQVSATASVTAVGVATGRPVPVAGAAPLTGPERSAVAVLEPAVDVTDVAVSGALVPFDADGVAVLAVQLQEVTGVDGVELTAVTINGAGSIHEADDVQLVRLWRDLGTPGELDGADVLIGLTAYFADDGVAAFAGLSAPIAAGGALDLLVTYDLDPTALPGEQLQATLGVTGLALRRQTGGAPVTTITGLPRSGPLREVDGFPELLVSGLATTGPGEVRGGATDVPMLRLRLETTAIQDIVVEALTVRASGNGDEATEVAAISLHDDLDRDGLVDPDDLLLARAAAPFGADDDPFTFSGLNRAVPAGGVVEWLVTYDLGPADSEQDTFALQVEPADVVVTAPALGGPAATIVGPTRRVVGGLTVALDPATPPGATLALGVSDQPVLLLGVTADAAEPVQVGAVRASAAGTADAQATFSMAYLVRDDGAAGVYEPGTDTVLDSAAFAADGTVTFAGLTETVGALATLRLWVVVDVDAAAPGGRTFVATLPRPADVTASGGLSSLDAFVSGTPVAGETFLIDAAGPAFRAAEEVLLGGAGAVLDLAAGDLDRDGAPDLAVLRADGALELLLGDGAGGFASAQTTGAIAGARRLALGDLDGDAVLDAVVLSATGVHVLLDDPGAGLLLAPVSYVGAGGADHVDLVLVDHDRDGHLDVVVADAGTTAALRGWRGSATGALTGGDALLLSSAPRRLIACDLDVDARPDLVWTTDAGRVGVALGAATFYPAEDLLPDVASPDDALVALQLDVDGTVDVVAVDVTGAELDVLQGLGPPPLGPGLVFDGTAASDGGLGAGTPGELVAGDWDGDGLTDLAVVHDVALVVHRGDGTLALFAANASSLAVGVVTAPDQVIAADFDRDGDPDLVVASTTDAAGHVALLRGDGEAGDGVASFEPPVTVAWGEDRPTDVALADFDRLGLADVAAAAALGRAVQRFVGDPLVPGNFAGSTGDLARLATGDVDGDGIPDLVASMPGGTDGVLLVLDPDGALDVSEVACLDDSDPGALALGDKDGDGRADVVVVERAARSVQLFRASGGGLAPALAGDRRMAAGGVTPVDVALADVDRDGRLDVVVLCAAPAELQVWRGLAGHGLAVTPLVSSLGAVPAPGALALGDLDRDGVVDAFVGCDGALKVLPGVGDGTFDGAAVAAFGAARARDVALGDLDRDGRLDAVVAQATPAGSGALLVHRGAGGFAFEAAVEHRLAGGGEPATVALGDVDGDGDLDAVAAVIDRDELQVWRGR